VSVARYLLGEPTAVLNASMVEDSPGSRADVSSTATLAFAGGATARLTSSALSAGFNLHARCERGTLSVTNYLFPFVYHSLTVTPARGAARTEQLYGGGETTFELQLRAFVAAVRHGSPFATTADDAVANMQVVDGIYEAAGLGARGGPRAAQGLGGSFNTPIPE
jgi:predicted dehydrogenase